MTHPLSNGMDAAIKPRQPVLESAKTDIIDVATEPKRGAATMEFPLSTDGWRCRCSFIRDGSGRCCPIVFCDGDVFVDVFQTKDAIRRNYPVIGRFRDLFSNLASSSGSISLRWTAKKCRSTGRSVSGFTSLQMASTTRWHSVRHET